METPILRTKFYIPQRRANALPRPGLIVAGNTNREIADELVISVGTAKWHVHNILQKLGVSNRSQATARARELGF